MTHSVLARRLVTQGTLATLLIGTTLTFSALAQSWPAKPIRVVVPFPAGGGTDLIAREVGNKVVSNTKWTFIYDNKPGSGGNIGVDAIAKAAPDGLNLVIGQTSNLAINPTLYSKLPYDPAKDLTPIVNIGYSPLIIVVATNSPFKNLAELLSAAKAQPTQINYATSGNGTVAHLATEMLQKEAGVRLTHIPYKGAAPAVTDVMAGQVLFTFPALITVRGNIQAQKLRMLAVTSSARLPSLPDVPTFKELGYEKMSVGAWYGYFAPKDTPNAVIMKFNSALATVLKDKTFVDKLIERGAIPLISTPEQMGVLIEKEKKFTAEVLALTQIKVDE